MLKPKLPTMFKWCPWKIWDTLLFYSTIQTIRAPSLTIKHVPSTTVYIQCQHFPSWFTRPWLNICIYTDTCVYIYIIHHASYMLGSFLKDWSTLQWQYIKPNRCGFRTKFLSGRTNHDRPPSCAEYPSPSIKNSPFLQQIQRLNRWATRTPFHPENGKISSNGKMYQPIWNCIDMCDISTTGINIIIYHVSATFRWMYPQFQWT